MDLLTTNDRLGHHAPSWYAATADQSLQFPAAQGTIKADVCIIGGGFTGLSCALALAEAGRRVVVLEASRVGSGASGRNGGQLGSGQRREQTDLEALFGRDEAAKLWDLGEASKELVRGLIAAHGINADLRPGVAWSADTAKETQELHGYAAFLHDRYGYERVACLSAEAFAEVCPSPAYRGGIIDWDAGHLHPLRFVQGLAQAADAAGAQIHEMSRVLSHIDGLVRTANAEVRAEHVVLAANGYLGDLSPQVAAKVMPINNFIVATQPLGARAAEVLRKDIAVADSRFVINYFRLSDDKRLLFGGGESYGYRFPRDITATVRKPMLEIFPSLADVQIDYAWGGTLAITRPRLPHVARLAPKLWSASGYSGHGVGTATLSGKVIAEAICGESDGFDTLAALPIAPFPGGPALRSPLLALAMTWFALRDRLGF